MADDECRPWYMHPAVWVVAATLLIVAAIATYLAFAWQRHALAYRNLAEDAKKRDDFAKKMSEWGFPEWSLPIEDEFVGGKGSV
jgi:hypothetical protein